MQLFPELKKKYTAEQQSARQAQRLAEFIAWGNVFCLDTNDGAIIKQVYPTDDDSIIECRSLNPSYPPFKVKKDLINGWYRVLMCLSLK